MAFCLGDYHFVSTALAVWQQGSGSGVVIDQSSIQSSQLINIDMMQQGGFIEKHKPVLAMLGLQFTYSGIALSTRAALVEGMNPKVFVVYRQAIATLVIAPLAYFSQGRNTRPSLGLRSLCLIFIASLIGITINQNIYFQGLYLASSSIASAMGNLVPAITFIFTAVLGMEKVDVRSLSSIAKIGGTVLCVGGAASIALLKGPKLLNMGFSEEHNSIIHLGGENWMMGCVLLFGSCCCWSFWLILQVPMSASCPDHLSLSALMCFFATLQSATITFFLEPDPTAWILDSNLQLLCCFYAGIVGSGISFFVQAWCISQRGPLFSAMFNPLCTVIVMIMACIFLHEELFFGSLIGSIAVVGGLYVVLWGKAKDLEGIRKETETSVNSTKTVSILIDNPSDEESCKTDLEEPLLCCQTKLSQVKERNEHSRTC